jgi:molybdopterin synthase catalytic subunit
MTTTQANDLLLLTSSPITVASAYLFVLTPAAGAIDVFVGTVRAEQSRGGLPLVALEYEAYPAMAKRVCHKIIDEARARWPVERCAIVHRVGRVELGEPSVVVAAACPHRTEAFDACRYMIDQLKARAPIWKEPIWADADKP